MIQDRRERSSGDRCVRWEHDDEETTQEGEVRVALELELRYGAHGYGPFHSTQSGLESHRARMDHGWSMSGGRGGLLEASVHDEELGPKGFGGQKRRPVVQATSIAGPSCETL